MVDESVVAVEVAAVTVGDWRFSSWSLDIIELSSELLKLHIWNVAFVA